MVKRGVDNLLLNNSEKNSNLKYILILLLILIVFSFVAIVIASSERKLEEIPVCGDGTFYETCSIDKPYYCDNGILIEKASFCGCPKLFLKKEGETCIFQNNSKYFDVQMNYFLRKDKNKMSFRVYEDIYNYVSEIPRVIRYDGEEISSRVNFKRASINEPIQREKIIPLVKEIQNIAPRNKVEQARIAISLVQHIPYNASDRKTLFAGIETDIVRYPYEVLYENQGICGEKSQLLAFLLKELGYGVVIFYFSKENHEAVGISCPIEKSFYGSGYCFVETGGPAIITDSFIEFSEGVKLNSYPEILLISEGISLPKRIYEYGDAKIVNAIRERNLYGFLNFWRYDKLIGKYNLSEIYYRG